MDYLLIACLADKYVCVSDARGQLPKGVAFDIKCQLRKYEHPTTVMMDNGANRFIKKVRNGIPPGF